MPRTPGPLLIAVDGRGGAGKSTLADALSALRDHSAIVHTDDIAWNHSRFGWADELAKHVIEPLRAGRNVHYRPTGWVQCGRTGAIEVERGCDLVIIEGTGVSQHELSSLFDLCIWVQADYERARSRALRRDRKTGVNGTSNEAEAFWNSWQREEVPFLSADAPWMRADVVTCGTPQEPLPKGLVLVRTRRDVT